MTIHIRIFIITISAYAACVGKATSKRHQRRCDIDYPRVERAFTWSEKHEEHVEKFLDVEDQEYTTTPRCRL
jgi:hypothetical protein